MAKSVRSRNLSIMITDIQGFSDTTSASSREELVDLIRKHQKLMVPVIRFHRGHIIKTMGDAFLCAFDSATDAVICALIIQLVLKEFNNRLRDESRMLIRIVINSGDVTIEGNDVFGDTVNIASRMEGLACFPGGSIGISESTFLLMNRNEIVAEQIGPVTLKGISYPVTVFQVPVEKQKLTSIPRHLLDLVESVIESKAAEKNEVNFLEEGVSEFLAGNVKKSDQPVRKDAVNARVCPVCRETFPDDTGFCEKDRVNLVKAEQMIPRCVKCGKTVETAAFCPDDGSLVIPEAMRGAGSCCSQNSDGVIPELLEDYNFKVFTVFKEGILLFFSSVETVLPAIFIFAFILLIISKLRVSGFIIGIPMIYLFSGAYAQGCFRSLRGEKTGFRDFLQFGGQNQLIRGGIKSLLYIIPGLILGVIPGVYFIISYLFMPLLIVDKNMDHHQALQISRRIIGKRFWKVAALFAIIMLMIVVFIRVQLSLLLTLPAAFCTLVVLYQQCVGLSLRKY